jgi:DnaK suppressor protein
VANPSEHLDFDAIRSELEDIRDRSAQGFGKRIGDGTTEAVRRLTDIGVGDSLERVLARTERAVAKLDDGSYGICDLCGDPIPPGRMRALPDGVLCLKCAASERVAPAARRR